MDLYIVKIENEKYNETLNILSNRLTEVELRAVNEFKFEKGKATKAVSILLSKYIIEKIIGLKEYIIKKNRYGKPYIYNYEDFFYNISHSGNYVICGVSKYEIGVDIEYAKPFRDILEIAKRFFSGKEYGYINSIKNDGKQVNAFYDIWTKKESFIKAVGQGVSLGLDKFDVPLELNKEKKIKYLNEDWYFMEEKEVDKEFPIAVCEKGNTTGIIKITNLELNDL